MIPSNLENMGKCLLLKIKGVKCKQLNYTSSSPSIRAFLQLHSRHTEGGPAQGTNLHLAFADFALSSYQQLIKNPERPWLPLLWELYQNKQTNPTTLYELIFQFGWNHVFKTILTRKWHGYENLLPLAGFQCWWQLSCSEFLVPWRGKTRKLAFLCYYFP